MSEDPVIGLGALTQLRRDFDETFAVLPPVREKYEPIIQIRVGNEVFAVRTGHIAGLAKDRKIVSLPSRIPELLGLAALRGSLIPVFDLAALLGIPAGVGAPSWLLLVRCDTLIGLAFDGFEGQQTPQGFSEEQSAGQHVRQLVRMGAVVRSVLDLPSLADSIQKRAGLREPAKETKQ
jgi:chemotaxis signal transduction protein